MGEGPFGTEKQYSSHAEAFIYEESTCSTVFVNKKFNLSLFISMMSCHI